MDETFGTEFTERLAALLPMSLSSIRLDVSRTTLTVYAIMVDYSKIITVEPGKLFSDRFAIETSSIQAA